MKDRRKLWLRLALWALVIAWMAVIFYFSAQAADDSERTSGRVVSWLIDHFDRSFSSLSPEAQLLRMEDWSFAVRKLAHFAVFAVLGFLCFAAFSVDLPPRRAFPAALILGGLPPRRAFPAALILGGVRAVLDEVQQAFVPGRSCELRDMGIDFAGVLLGAAFLLLILHWIQRKKLKK